MSKRLDKIAKIEEQMKQLANQRKQERQKYNAEERKARTKRLCSRHGLLEKHMPDLITITVEQFEAFIKRGINTSYGQKILAEIIAPNVSSATSGKPHNTGGNAENPQAAARSGA